MNTKNNYKADNQTLKFQYVDGLCGSGKTWSMGEYIKNEANIHNKYMIITPSIILANQIHQQLELAVNCKIVHSENTPNVATTLMKTIEDIDFQGNGVVVCTQQAFFRIPFFQNKESWFLIVDEIPKIDNFYNPSLPYNHPILTQYIEIDEEITPSLYKMKLIQPEKYSDISPKRFASRNIDDVDAIFKPMILNMRDNHDCFADKKNWDKIVINNEITSDKSVDMTYGNSKNMLYFLTMLNPEVFSGFKLVIMMGANFEQSLLFKYWHEYKNVEFHVCSHISKNLRYNQYKNGHRLTLVYLQEEPWSKYSRDKSIDGITREEHYANLVNKMMAGKDFLFMANNDSKYKESINGRQIPVISHGLNDFAACDNIYFSPALNRQPKHLKMLNDLGIDSTFINRASSHETAHQGIMRCSMRNPEANTDVTAIVPDKATAEELARMFFGCKIKPIDGVAKKVIAVSQIERNSKSRLNKILNHNQLNQSNVESIITNDKSVLITNFINNDKCNQNGLENNNNINVSTIDYIYDKSIDSDNGSAMQLIKRLKVIWTNRLISSKDEIILFNGTKFKSDDERTLKNSAYSSFLILDIDDGDLSPEEFKRIFEKENKHSMIMMNSFSRSAEKLNNYRAIFFIKEKVNDETYRELQKYIQDIIKSHGYITATKSEQKKILEKNPDAKFSGIDLSKTHTASFFYLPCKVVDRKEYAFFWKCHVKNNAELIRYAIDPKKILQYSLEKTELQKLVFENNSNERNGGCSNNLSNEEIKNILKSGEIYLGTHANYGRLAASMRYAGFTQADFIEVTPFVSHSKSTKDANKFWESWGKYKDITKGTLNYLINNR